ncbi:MAG TPA: glycosyl hydrolase family 18 protein, partial [Streptosporangiaceae bacterium]
MTRRTTLQTALAAATAAIAFVATGAGAANATTNATTNAAPLPAHVFAPYFEGYNTSSGGLAQLSQASGASYLSLAFLQTATHGSCTAYWEGDTSMPIAQSSFGSAISTIQANGGNVIPSFGGASADNGGTDIAASCTSVSKIAAVYEDVFTTYNVPRIDLDVEGNELGNAGATQRRNEAIAQVEAWAKSNGRSVQFSYTLPSNPTGMSGQDKKEIQSAIADGATISSVNMMTFDYFIGSKQEMATDTKSAGSDTHSQLQALYPSLSSTQIWNMIGIIEMPGIDDFGAAETFTQADANTVLSWASSNGINTLSFWALQRDNGGCPGTKGSDTCSGISQPT